MKRPASEVLYAYTLLQQPLAIMDVMQVNIKLSSLLVCLDLPFASCYISLTATVGVDFLN